MVYLARAYIKRGPNSLWNVDFQRENSLKIFEILIDLVPILSEEYERCFSSPRETLDKVLLSPRTSGYPT